MAYPVVYSFRGYNFRFPYKWERKISKKNRKICQFGGFFINLHDAKPDARLIYFEIQDSPRRYQYSHNAGSSAAGSQFPGVAVLAAVDFSGCAFRAVGARVFVCLQLLPLSRKAL